jgi:hypothetical protein
MKPKYITCPHCQRIHVQYDGYKVYVNDAPAPPMFIFLAEEAGVSDKERIAGLEKALEECVDLLEGEWPHTCADDSPYMEDGCVHGCVRCRSFAITKNARDLLAKKQEAE